MISDKSAGTEYAFAREILAVLEIDDAEDSDEAEPAGNLDILADLGMSGQDLRQLCVDDVDYPDDQLTQIAEKLGFGDAFRELVEAVEQAD